MVARKKNPSFGQWAWNIFYSLADVLTESSECLTRVIDLIYKSVVFVCWSAWMLIFYLLLENLCERGGGRKLMQI